MIYVTTVIFPQWQLKALTPEANDGGVVWETVVTGYRAQINYLNEDGDVHYYDHKDFATKAQAKRWLNNELKQTTRYAIKSDNHL